MLLHGCEGSVNSNYIVANTMRLYDAGFDVFRLNFRDHGDTHHLNPGIFHSCRLDEVIDALRDLQDRLEPGPWFQPGYSLGGNFSQRVALNAERVGLDPAQVVAVCPVINPANAMSAMKQGLRFYQWYFERKWSRSLRSKQACFAEVWTHGIGGAPWQPGTSTETAFSVGPGISHQARTYSPGTGRF